MKFFNIYITGVGGQGIGLLSEAMLLAGDNAGLDVRAVDTHGLAQRGGTVESFLRVGKDIFSPLIPPGKADLVVALEINEALRGMEKYLRSDGTLIYYRTEWQPLEVRLNRKGTITPEVIVAEAGKRNIRVFEVFEKDLPDTRMQNVVVLANIVKHSIIPGVTIDHYIKALESSLKGNVLAKNLEIFQRITT
ncbi:2-oxoacid:acceptor oxidoreductase family protein [Myxococcota bacterium]|nr:2-oxoacid:acceptor oxidoreductase family protein [Myxococcota bacterium]MBU1379917.1 2-oxoacid:acceptor oxidoreductase family protein [Myxococcota bacterium]MBU1497398.1 2-oxoacid:acceptor oxidoreductase family protein [Myxococcota bacterium]